MCVFKQWGNSIIQIFSVWVCFLQRSLSFLEKNVSPSRAMLHTWAERKGVLRYFQTSINLRNSYSSRLTYSTDEAGIVPGVAEHLQELVSGLNGKIVAMATSPKESVEVLFLREKKHTDKGSGLKCYSCLCMVVSQLLHSIIAYLVCSTALHPQGESCCFWLDAGSRHTGNSGRATFVWGHWSPPVVNKDSSFWISELIFTDHI